jgi:hypothetical protein
MNLLGVDTTRAVKVSGEALSLATADLWSIHGQSKIEGSFEKTATSDDVGGCGDVILVGETGFEPVAFKA